MSIETMALVLHHSRSKGTDKVVLLGIANHSGDGGAWPSVNTLARYANVHERNVQRSIEALVKLGELAVHRQAGGLADATTWSRPNRYDVLLACPATCDRTANHRPIGHPSQGSYVYRTSRSSPSYPQGGVANSPPGGADATRGVAQTPPGGVAQTPPEPSTEPTPLQVVPQLQDTREDPPPHRVTDHHAPTPQEVARVRAAIQQAGAELRALRRGGTDE